MTFLLPPRPVARRVLRAFSLVSSHTHQTAVYCRRPLLSFSPMSRLATVADPVPKPPAVERRKEYWKRRNSDEMEAASRWGELELPLFDTAKMSDEAFVAFGGHKRLRNMAAKHAIFDHVFGGEVFLPEKNISATFGDESSTDTSFYRGNILMPEKMQQAPTLQFTPSASLYTVALVDPDGRFDGEAGEFAYWIVANLDSPTAQGDTLLPYIPPVTPKGSGYHRFVLVLLEQLGGAVAGPATATPLDAADLDGRHVSLVQLQRQHNLKPVAFSFAQVAWDESVPNTFRERLEMEEPVFSA